MVVGGLRFHHLQPPSLGQTPNLSLEETPRPHSLQTRKLKCGKGRDERVYPQVLCARHQADAWCVRGQPRLWALSPISQLQRLGPPASRLRPAERRAKSQWCTRKVTYVHLWDGQLGLMRDPWICGPVNF